MSSEDHKSIDEAINKILKKRFLKRGFSKVDFFYSQNFERMSVSKEFALKMFEYNRFKKQIIESIPDGDEITLYRSGDFVDLCRGPHLQHTGKIKVCSMRCLADITGGYCVKIIRNILERRFK